jgi:hypothetical protein
MLPYWVPWLSCYIVLSIQPSEWFLLFCSFVLLVRYHLVIGYFCLEYRSEWVLSWISVWVSRSFFSLVLVWYHASVLASALYVCCSTRDVFIRCHVGHKYCCDSFLCVFSVPLNMRSCFGLVCQSTLVVIWMLSCISVWVSPFLFVWV